jgi:tRNA uridine 5-carboxymethylaminomethyl modification enzyme
MFTSRAEERLSLRHDNADQRLTQRGFDAGLVDSNRHGIFRAKMKSLDELRRSVGEISIDGKPLTALLKMPEFNLQSLPAHIRQLATAEVWELVETDLKYEGYMQRQTVQNAKLFRDLNRAIPTDLDYEIIAGLRRETRQKLSVIKPPSLGHAARVSGITPADISIISIWLQKKRRGQPAGS